MDLQQFLNNVGETLERGDVVVLSPQQASLGTGEASMPVLEVGLCQENYDSAVCGVVYDLYTEHRLEAGPEADEASEPKSTGKGRKKQSAEKSKSQSFTLEELEKLDRTKIEAGQIGHLITSGIMPSCKVDADKGAIKVGDLLTTSETKGHAQKVTDPTKAVGAVLGKALAPMKKGKGTIPILVTLK
jgi:hypothetical protein